MPRKWDSLEDWQRERLDGNIKRRTIARIMLEVLPHEGGLDANEVVVRVRDMGVIADRVDVWNAARLLERMGLIARVTGYAGRYVRWCVA